MANVFHRFHKNVDFAFVYDCACRLQFEANMKPYRDNMVQLIDLLIHPLHTSLFRWIMDYIVLYDTKILCFLEVGLDLTGARTGICNAGRGMSMFNTGWYRGCWGIESAPNILCINEHKSSYSELKLLPSDFIISSTGDWSIAKAIPLFH